MMNRVQTLLLTLVCVLVIACIGLIVAVAKSNAAIGSGKDSKYSFVLYFYLILIGHLNDELIQTTTTTSITTTEKLTGVKWEDDPRLPKHLLPLHYDLWLHPNLNTGLFSGLYWLINFKSRLDNKILFQGMFA